ncbi:MAG TPA: DUF1285 domain-containing protein, partial [Rhabdaerophilum sp.]|nr:DUF1285 domain-containing protein [Rhabdaerophilum sp.]
PKRFLDVAAAHAGRRLPPVEKWNPDYCGEIPMRIARDGRWFYMGTPIERMPLVKLFATILRKDGGQHVLVTPVERVGIEVEDAPFLAVEMEAMAGAQGETLAFRTNLDDLVVAGADHPLRFELDQAGGLKPYIRVRGDLWARLTRSLALDLAERIVEESGGRLGLRLDGEFHPLPEGAMAG